MHYHALGKRARTEIRILIRDERWLELFLRTRIVVHGRGRHLALSCAAFSCRQLLAAGICESMESCDELWDS